MPDPLNWLSDELKSLSEHGLLRNRRRIRPLPNERLLVGDTMAWDFASNDYLGLSNDPRVIKAAEDALRSHGIGAKASALISGRSDLHVALEESLADFENAESAILFPTGMAANVGTIAALASSGDTVFCDRLNHASLVDGCRLSGARLRVYRHNDLDRLADSLAQESARRTFIVTDSVFSMDGDLAPLVELCEISERHGSVLIVDEAHGTGVFGPHGRGVAELLGVEDRISVKIGTLSKAIGSLGGFVTGSQSLIEFLWNKARTQIYSTALPPALCAAANAAIEIVKTEPRRREQLHASARLLRGSFERKGIGSLENSIGPIVPIVLREAEAAVMIAEQLLARGFLVGAIRPPTVPRGTSRLRITLHYGIPDEAVEELAQVISDCCPAFGADRDHTLFDDDDTNPTP